MPLITLYDQNLPRGQVDPQLHDIYNTETELYETSIILSQEEIDFWTYFFNNIYSSLADEKSALTFDTENEEISDAFESIYGTEFSTINPSYYDYLQNLLVDNIPQIYRPEVLDLVDSRQIQLWTIYALAFDLINNKVDVSNIDQEYNLLNPNNFANAIESILYLSKEDLNKWLYYESIPLDKINPAIANKIKLIQNTLKVM